MELGWLARGLLVAAIGLGWPAPAAHAEERARLVYVRGEGAEPCPAEVDLRLWVVARLGYDPFSPHASRVVLARIESEPAGLRGNVELVDAQGLSSGQRSMTSPRERCDELARAMALSISLAIDPDRASQPRSPMRPAPSPSPEPPEAPGATRPTPPPSLSPARLSARETPLPSAEQRGSQIVVGVAFTTTSGALPGLALGGLGYVGFHASGLAFSLEGRALASLGRDLGRGGRLSGSLIGPGASLCAKAVRDFSACAVGLIAAQRLSSSAVAEPRANTGVFVGVGPRLVWRAPLGSRFGLTLALEGLVDLSRNTARFSSADVWTTPLLSGGGWLGVDTHFL